MQEDTRSNIIAKDNYKVSSKTPQGPGNFVSPGVFLFAGQLIVAGGNWLYWIVISRFVTTSDVGYATSVYSLVLLFSTVAQLGLEFPLLRKSTDEIRRLFGTVMIIELGITAISLPILFWTSTFIYAESINSSLIAMGILVLSSVGFVSRFALLGISQSKTVLVLDLIGTIAKFASGLLLISAGYGPIGILASIMINAAILAIAATMLANRRFGLAIGDNSIRKEVIKDGLVNMPAKLSGFFVVSLSIILLAYLGVDSSQIGTFYIAMMMSVVAGSFASSLAYMSIPASSRTKVDLSTTSMRIGMASTAPVITLLFIAPTAILSLIGSEYTAAENVLPILAIAVLPSVVLSNASSKFNNLSQPSKLSTIGLLRIGIFLGSFFILVPDYGVVGAAYAIILSFAGSAMLALAYSGRAAIKYVLLTMAAVTMSLVLGRIIIAISSPNMEMTAGLLSMGLCAALIFTFRCVSPSEFLILFKTVHIRRASR